MTAGAHGHIAGRKQTPPTARAATGGGVLTVGRLHQINPPERAEEGNGPQRVAFLAGQGRPRGDGADFEVVRARPGPCGAGL
jgi:hypothetical protein